MAKVYGFHQLELNPGVTAEEFERFMAEEGAALLQTSPKTTLLRGDRGARTGRYALIIEFESEEARNQAYPVADRTTEENTQAMPEAQRRVTEQFLALVSGIGDPSSYTDYVVIEE